MQATPGFGKRKKSVGKRVVRSWSTHQENIFKDVAIGEGHSIVLAAPGSGKSTTILESLYHIPEVTRKSGRVLMAAFNSSIVDELKSKAPENINTFTFHKIGFQSVRNNWKSINSRNSIDAKGEVAEHLAVQEVGILDTQRALRKNLIRALSLSKAELALNIESISNVIAEHAISTSGLSLSTFSNHVFNMMSKTKDKPVILNNKPVISFDDMIWLPYVNGWSLDQYDRVFIDECQDLSNAKTELVLKSLSASGRLVAVGDKMQAIFRFCGSSSSVVDKLQARLLAKVLTLSVSYRLPKTVISLAKEINPLIEAAEGAIEGEIESVSLDKITDKVTSGCAILSRTNYQLVNLAFKLVKQGYKANIQGKDIGDRFLWRIDGWNAESVIELRKGICNWYDEMFQILTNKKYPTDRLIDEAKSILLFTEGANNIAEVKDRIKSFFSDDPSQIKLSSVHKSKGLEWDNVLVLNDTFKRGKNEEEDCIYYVGITRAKKKLIFVHGK